MCEYCGEQAELRPYGRKGARICFVCAMTPENKAQTELSFKAQLEAIEGVSVIGTEAGPFPLGGKRS